MSAETLISSLLHIAKEDLDASRLLGPSGNRNAIYLCEQCAEKIIRAILTSEKQHAGIGHDLEAMIDDVPDVNPLKTQLRDIEKLTMYATAYRYPDRREKIPQTPDPTRLGTFQQKVEALLVAVAAHFAVNLANKSAIAAHTNPIR